MILVDRLGVFFYQISDLIGGSLILPWDTLYNPSPIVFVERIIGGGPAPVPTYTTRLEQHNWCLLGGDYPGACKSPCGLSQKSCMTGVLHSLFYILPACQPDWLTDWLTDWLPACLTASIQHSLSWKGASVCYLVLGDTKLNSFNRIW